MYEVVGSYTPDKLIAGDKVPTQVKGVMIAAGQGVLKRGSVIGIIDADGKGKLAAKAAVDGSKVAKYILADDVDTTSAVVAQCYESGLFNRQALIFAAGNTAADHEDNLRQYGIFLNDNIAY